MNRTDILALADRVEDGAHSDMALAREVQCTVGGWHRITPSQCRRKHGGYIAPDDWIGRHSDGAPILDSLHGTIIHHDVPDITASIDAVERLREALLPGWRVEVKEYSDGYVSGVFDPEDFEDGSTIYGNASTEPRARLAAVLRAYAGRG